MEEQREQNDSIERVFQEKTEKKWNNHIEWMGNHEKITQCYDMLLIENKGKRPTVTTIAEMTGISRQTVSKHVKAMLAETFAERNAEYLTNFRAKSTKLIERLYQKADEGDVPAMKLFFQLVEGWSEKQSVEHSGRIESTPTPPALIQINVDNGGSD